MKEFILLLAVLSPFVIIALLSDCAAVTVLAWGAYAVRITIAKGEFLTRLYDDCLGMIEYYESELLNA